MSLKINMLPALPLGKEPVVLIVLGTRQLAESSFEYFEGKICLPPLDIEP